MITLTLEAQTPHELRVQMEAILGAVSKDAPSVETPAKPATEAKKPRGRPRNKPETIEAKAEEVKSDAAPAETAAENAPAEGDAKPLALEDVKPHAYGYMEAAMAANPDDKDAGRNAFKELLDHFEIERFSHLKDDQFAAMIALADEKKAAIEG